MFGLVIFVPVTALSLLGAAVLGNRNVRVGRWLASVGVCSNRFLRLPRFRAHRGGGGTGDAPPEQLESTAHPGQRALVVVPYIAGAAESIYVVGRLWRQARPSTPVLTAA